jgi:nucleoside-diphosphate-sugar epimerase
MKKILITGAFGLVGSDLVSVLQKKYGRDKVICLSHKTHDKNFDGITEKGDIQDNDNLEKIVHKYDIKQIYHLAGLLSVGSEKNPQLAWQVNLIGLKNILDLSVKHKIQVFWPSSIAAFGPTTPRINTPQHTVLEPTTMYGVNKVAGELLCQYYFLKYGLDVRCLRYPGLNGYKAKPGDGTTEYAIHIFYGAIKEKKYTCFLKEDTILPMMYIDDAINGTVQLMEADPKKITIRTGYNFAAISFSPKELVAEIQKIDPEFTCTYEPDYRQQIADTWPKLIDDSQARKDWGWHHKYDLPAMTEVLYENIKKKLSSDE